MREIQLTQGKVALVDDCDYDVLRQYNWHAVRTPKTFYARRNLPIVNGKWNKEHMHRVVLERKLGRAITPGMMPDHEDGNGLNNRRDNLREATRGQNNSNCRRHGANPSSQYLGVGWHKATNKWQVKIRVADKDIYLGIYTTELAAALAREAYINLHPELNARANFPEDTCC